MRRRPSLRSLFAALLLAAAPDARAQERPPERPAERPRPAQPAVPRPSAAEARRLQIDRLLDELSRAPDAASAAPLDGRLRALWAQGASPAVALLLRRAARNSDENAPGEAAEDLDAAITLQPDHVESWTLRGQALARAGDPAAAAADLQQALRLEPRHFPTLLALSAIQQERGDLAGALRSLEAALRINPRMPGGEARLRDLRRRALGDDA